MPETAPYGSWKSPITAEMAARGSMTFSGLALDGPDLYWLETRPEEGGRSVLMHRDAAGSVSECTPREFDVRTGVHEYGGGALTASRGSIYFANAKDECLYTQRPGKLPEILTRGESHRFADMVVNHVRGRLLCVCEDHSKLGEPTNSIIAVDLRGGAPATPIAFGRDFYASPRLSPDGTQLAYLTWDHPNMPWDGCELHLAQLNPDCSIAQDACIAGSSTEAIFQPGWSPNGVLHFAAEFSGWWNLYRWIDARAQPLCPKSAEFGRAMWLFGYSTYGFVDENRIFCCYTEAGIDKLAWLDATTGKFSPIECPYTEIDFLQCNERGAAFVGGSPTQPPTVVTLDFTANRYAAVRSAFEVAVDEGFISTLAEINFLASAGQHAHAYYYPPMNRDFRGPQGERAPLIVIGHGGPTSAASTSLRYVIQYWTSRGFGVADVNYRGSTGYGREYRRSLDGQWGIADVEDCCNAALALVEQGLADRDRLIIKGRSAGGFTAFACLTFHPEVFAVGVSHCGVADLEVFARDTHKFESHYLETLVGPYPERRDLYQARSPIHFTENLRCPLLLFQGQDDKVVPPDQSASMFDVVRRKGIPTAYVILQGEGHVFHKADTWKRVHEGELYFLSSVLGFPLTEPVERIAIENL